MEIKRRQRRRIHRFLIILNKYLQNKIVNKVKMTSIREHYIVCEYCEYVTQKKHLMESHMQTNKHKKNTEKNYIVLSDVDSIIDKAKAKKDLNLLKKKELNDWIK